ncbi:MAG TPA: S8 family serine peptidase [Stellaceae bacterium]|nr:S8 family serine peptidase [Stellaceae bacterium]
MIERDTFLAAAALALSIVWGTPAQADDRTAQGFGNPDKPGSLENLLQPPAEGAKPPAPTRSAHTPSGRPRSQEILVAHRHGVGPDPATLGRRIGAEVGATYELPSVGFDVSVFRLRAGDSAEAAIRRLPTDPAILAADRNQSFATAGEVTTASADEITTSAAAGHATLRARTLQYALGLIHAPAPEPRITGKGVRVAVIDSGIDPRHASLQGKVLLAVDLVGEAPDMNPSLRAREVIHGTGIAGVIAAEGGLQGVAPDARLISIKAFSVRSEHDGETYSSSDRIVRAIDVALRLHARIINMSFGGPPDRLIELMVREALAQGAVIVAAAGNSGPGSTSYPAAYPGVIAVTASDRRDELYPEAASGAFVTVAAPGVDIITTAPNGGYQVLTGTSIAAAHVSGLAALLIQANPSLSPSEVKELIAGSGQPLGPGSQPDHPTIRLIDVAAALGEISRTH